MPTNVGNSNGPAKVGNHDDEEGDFPTVRVQTIDELHSLQRKKSAPTTPRGSTPTSALSLSEEERSKLQLESIR